ncbi:amidohydrolase family protein [Kutzneria sp. NPDC052558]|uniref:amidohydrolase family protein n=1 Tax=Kutzneria sp. NPDC052558 TaxID=3364121 RepID=UPI0037C5C40F
MSEVGSDLLAGAAATLLDGVRNIAARTSFSLSEALSLATAVPARLLSGIRPGTGQFRLGGPADLVLLDDSCGLLDVVQSGRWLD